MRRVFDPLTFIPTPEAISNHLQYAEGLVKRLRILLQLSEQIQAQNLREERILKEDNKKGRQQQ